MFVEKGCGKKVWDPGDGKGKLTTGMFLRRFCGLELFVEGGCAVGEGLWLCLPFEMKGGGGEKEKGRLRVGRKYTQLVEDAVSRFWFAVDTLGMDAGIDEGKQCAERRLEHWRSVGDRKDTTNSDSDVKLMLFSAGFVVA